MIFEKWSPKIIGYVDNPEHKKIQNKLIKECIKVSKKIRSGGKAWISKKTYNTLNTYDISLDDNFKPLNNWILNQVKEYSNNLNYKNNFKCVNGWISLYHKNDFQEYHTHNTHSLSAVYFLKSNVKKSSKIIFKVSPDPFVNEPTSETFTRDTANTVYYDPVPGRLLIFKSDLPHCVERSEEKNTRISLAYNFDIV